MRRWTALLLCSLLLAGWVSTQVVSIGVPAANPAIADGPQPPPDANATNPFGPALAGPQSPPDANCVLPTDPGLTL